MGTIVERYVHRAALVGLGSLLSLGSIVSTSLASSIPTLTASGKEDSRGTLRQGLPGRRLGGGTRGDRVFTDAYAYLAALVTSDNLSQTTATQPTLLFSVPNMVSAQDVEFILRDSDGEDIYQTTFRLNSDAGLVCLDLSKTAAAPLQVGKDYRWYFSIVSAQGNAHRDNTHRASDIVVHGNIRRVDGDPLPALETTGANALPMEQPVEKQIAKIRALYEEKDLWHDAAVALYALRQAHPDNSAVATEWDRLVEFAGLSAVIQPATATVKTSVKF